MDEPDQPPLLRRRLRPGELVAFDGVVAVGYGLVLTGGALAHPSGVPALVRVALVSAVALPLAARRRWPLPVFSVVLVASIVAMVLGVLRDAFLAAAFALYPVALGHRRPRWEPTLAIGAVSALCLLGGTVGGPVRGPDLSGDSAVSASGQTVILLVFGAALLGGTWTVGRAVRERRDFAARAAARVAGDAVADERLRIARELHDVVSHTLSVIGVKAAIANHVAETRPEEVRDALRVIEVTSRDALTQMRHMLGVLRADGEAAELGPAPTLADLARVADRAALAGVAVDLDVRGGELLPGDVELSVYRIVQEAVTNVIRHAAPARCRVLVNADTEGVRVTVSDDGGEHAPRPPGRAQPEPGFGGGEHAPRPPGRAQPEPGAGHGEHVFRFSGHGLIGMRERAAMHGGTFSAGPRPGGGFAVTVYLPTGVRAAR